MALFTRTLLDSAQLPAEVASTAAPHMRHAGASGGGSAADLACMEEGAGAGAAAASACTQHATGTASASGELQAAAGQSGAEAVPGVVPEPEPGQGAHRAVARSPSAPPEPDAGAAGLTQTRFVSCMLAWFEEKRDCWPRDSGGLAPPKHVVKQVRLARR